MLSNVINAGKDIANKLTNKFLNLSEIEVKIKTATNDDNWGPNGSLMREIADETFSTTNLQEVMTFLWYRIFTEKPPNNRRTYKGLVLLTYLIVNGSELIAASCRAHLGDIKKLQSYIDGHGVADVAIRRKASDICDLLSDSQRLSDERKRAKSYHQTRNYRSATVTGADGSDSNRQTRNAQPLGDIDDWDIPGSKSLPHVIGESFMNFVNTFTQNISGPPPTETHDNFDIPAMQYEISTPTPPPMATREDESVCNSAPQPRSSNQPVLRIDSSNRKESSNNKAAAKSSLPIAVVPLDRPIIDFSEPDAINADVDFLLAVNNNTIDNDIDEEFGNLRAGDHSGDAIGRPSQLQLINNNYYHPDNSYTHADFCGFVSSDSKEMSNLKSNQSPPSVTTSSIQLSNPQAQSQLGNSSSTMPKSDKKIGSTWNEIDALNIDLNNLCGRKRMYSKS